MRWREKPPSALLLDDRFLLLDRDVLTEAGGTENGRAGPQGDGEQVEDTTEAPISAGGPTGGRAGPTYQGLPCEGRYDRRSLTTSNSAMVTAIPATTLATARSAGLPVLPLHQ